MANDYGGHANKLKDLARLTLRFSDCRKMVDALVKELGLPLPGPDGNQVAYELSNKRTGREYKESDSLGSAGTKSGDVLLLTSTFVAG